MLMMILRGGNWAAERVVGCLFAVMISAAIAGCTGTGVPDASEPSRSASPTSSAPPHAGQACQDLAARGQQVRFGSSQSMDLGGVVFGTGANAVVLISELSSSICTWLPYGLKLANAGYRVLTFDFPGWGSSAASDSGKERAVIAAVEYLRGDGAKKIVLIGAESGAAAMLMAAPHVTPRVDGVVALSAPLALGLWDVLGAVRELRVNAMFIAGWYDGTAAADARALNSAMPRGGVQHEYRSVRTDVRGAALLDVGVNQPDPLPKVYEAVERFVREAFSGN